MGQLWKSSNKINKVGYPHAGGVGSRPRYPQREADGFLGVWLNNPLAVWADKAIEGVTTGCNPTLCVLSSGL